MLLLVKVLWQDFVLNIVVVDDTNLNRNGDRDGVEGTKMRRSTAKLCANRTLPQSMKHNPKMIQHTFRSLRSDFIQ